MKKVVVSILFIVGVLLLETALSIGAERIVVFRRLHAEGSQVFFIIPFVVTLAVAVISLGVVAFIIRLRKQSIKETFYIKKTSGKNIRTAILLGALIGLISISYHVAAFFSMDSETITAVVQDPNFMTMVVNAIILMFTWTFFAIISIANRELIHRGAILFEVRKHMRDFRAVMVLAIVGFVSVVAVFAFSVILDILAGNGFSGINFSDFTFGNFVYRILVGILISVALYILCCKTNSIWAPVAAGLAISVFNPITSTIEMIFVMHRPRTYDLSESIAFLFNPRAHFPVPQGVPLIIMLLFVLTVIGIIALILRRFWNNNSEKLQETHEYHDD